MPSSLQNPADVVNAALVRIGWKQQIGNLRDGSAAADAALSLYGQTRDELLRTSNWDFAQRNIALTLLKSAPPGGYIPPTTWDPTINPPIPWTFSYVYPGDCIKLRAVKPTPIFIPEFDPSANRFSIDNDYSYTPAQRVILCNVPAALAVYTGRVTDPATWAPDFAEALIELLGERLAPGLVAAQAAQFEAAEATVQTQLAKMEQG